jgi:hypothetical protein
MEYDLWQASPGTLKDFQSYVQALQSGMHAKRSQAGWSYHFLLAILKS